MWLCVSENERRLGKVWSKHWPGNVHITVHYLWDKLLWRSRCNGNLPSALCCAYIPFEPPDYQYCLTKMIWRTSMFYQWEKMTVKFAMQYNECNQQKSTINSYHSDKTLTIWWRSRHSWLPVLEIRVVFLSLNAMSIACLKTGGKMLRRLLKCVTVTFSLWSQIDDVALLCFNITYEELDILRFYWRCR